MKQRGTMEESRWRKMLVFFILLLQFTGALSSDRDLFLLIPVRAGDDVTLPCRNVDPRFSDCSSTTWIYSKSRQSTVELVIHGEVEDSRSDRLSVSANCSLVLKKVTAEDVGLYTCRQFISDKQEGPDAAVHLSLVNLTEDQNQNRVTLSCSVVTDKECKHRVRWLIRGRDVDKENKEITESSSSCSAAVTFQTSHFIYQTRFKDLKCEIKTEDNKVHIFTFSSHPSDKRKTTTTSPSETSGTGELKDKQRAETQEKTNQTELKESGTKSS
ncbi:uncharacterized protein LOC119776129 [Cyprinodon tularosa]|uniref:uncharacterized protein LOC119776129 n=1 Tax=Cyprinodon tularosa TaxID=77115 RepID=UPI0018E25D26|nr:uncharacterized protein LOC119776129 [Cyprinodon tularosa]